jgi:type IV fimbrial biogenesis protein FimT
MMKMKLKNGFSLIELVVVLAIISIVATSAIPSLFSMVEKNQSANAINKIRSAISLTRINAIKSASIATLCPTDNNISCGKDWSKGMMIFVDYNGDKLINNNDKLVRVFDKFSHTSAITWKAFQNKPYLQYVATGFSNNQNGTFTYCSKTKNLEFAEMLIINRAGRARLATDSNGDGIVEGASKKPPKCS